NGCNPARVALKRATAARSVWRKSSVPGKSRAPFAEAVSGQELCDLRPPLTAADWRRSRLALLNEKQKPFELGHMHLEEIPSALDRMAPLCWNCHQQERARQAEPPRIVKGDRRNFSKAAGE
ncbi:MAG TPA: hypothetical protein VF772_22110, partial [Terriglobales bacterium]